MGRVGLQSTAKLERVVWGPAMSRTRQPLATRQWLARKQEDGRTRRACVDTDAA